MPKAASDKLKPIVFDRVPPHDMDSEQSLLGSMLLSNEIIGEISEIVSAESFYSDINRQIYQVMIELYSKGEPADPITVSDKLMNSNSLETVGGKSYIHTLINMVPTAANAPYYASIVENKALSRSLIKAGTQIAADGYDSGAQEVEKLLDKAENAIYSIAKRRISEKFVPINDLLISSFEQIEHLYENKGSVIGVPTGFTDLDEKLSGLHRSDLIIVAARPSMGKTSLALQIARNAAIDGKTPVAIFSLEMDRHQLVQRLMCSEARVDAQDLRTGHLSEEDWPKLSSAVGRLGDAPIFIDDTPSLTILELRAKARRLMAQNDVGLIVVDYLQLMHSHKRSDSRQQEISEISRSLKILARELNVPVIAISQLSRAVEQRGGDKRPMLSDLRDSGAIEQDADVVMFIYRDEYYNPDSEERGIAEISISKHRNGPTGKVRLVFLEHYTMFANLAKNI